MSQKVLNYICEVLFVKIITYTSMLYIVVQVKFRICFRIVCTYSAISLVYLHVLYF